ncbi:UPF0179 family protein [Methanothermobacter tenebrarum]|uniref:UPF0179 protein DPC56_07155 n=1 Tax=Methanothermobacter tenebrarum TaxID=680118 RepID=A0A328P8D2_9EURY|nr:UPF0179 family protein [Methanothermobacter tenebrarum]MBC7100316.1 UPF0179 family protein [Methanobacteriales archaeon]MBC7118145.1 UPF0179 family protein [Methanobacteriaceae archaeon]NPV64786.1 UPF0179 family protein [Methanobacteriaceae archaeon]RAO78627.1 hypothetical protein DPC56_07155 [Methanothermobacter tenebrarum]
MITLIGEKLAKKGLTFMYYGPAKACEDCRYKSVCIDPLETGRIYKIKEVKDTEHPCPIHESGKVKVVEVEKANIEALIDAKKAFEGSVILFETLKCDEKCDMRSLCFPEGIKASDRCRILKNFGRVNECKKGYKLNKVLLEIISKK